MSLKAVHLFFVGAFTSLSLACAGLKARDYFSPQGTPGDLLFALGAIASGVAILVYGKYFLKKLKHISYL